MIKTHTSNISVDHIIKMKHKFSRIYLILTFIILIFSINLNLIIINKTYTQEGVENSIQPTETMTLPELFEKVERSVVQVTETDGETNLIGSRLGSGFVYDEEGHIITNYHVVAGSNGNPEVTFLDGTTYQATVVGTDPFTDLAVIRVSGLDQDKLVPLQIGDSSTLRVGEKVVAIGNPFGLSGSMTEGIVSGLGRLLPASDPQMQAQAEFSSFSIPDIIQTDAAINPGNSGGPLINERGEVVGINTAIFSATGLYSGVGFAVPANAIKKVIPSLIETGSYNHPYLGIVGTDITPRIAEILGLQEARGFLVTGVSPDSPAEKAGIRGGSAPGLINGMEIITGGDIIVGIDGNTVRKIDDILTHLERDKQIGDEVVLTIVREGNIENRTTILEERPNTIRVSQDVPDSSTQPEQQGRDASDLYRDCVNIAGRGICDFLFQR